MSRTWFMHQRARSIVQQGVGGGAAGVSPFSFTDPSFSNGVVEAIVDDGAGGKIVGGTFTSVTCNVTSTTYTTGYERLIRLKPNGEVDAAWSCPVGSSGVNALAIDVPGGVLYVGGSFTLIGGASKTNLAAVSVADGTVDSTWTCNSGGLVHALAFDGAADVLYAGGAYATIGGETRDDLAAIVASTGVVKTDWICNVSGGNCWVLCLDTANDVLYAGGFYSGIGGESKQGLAAITASTGVVIAGWTCNIISAYAFALALDVGADRLYVGGTFASIGGVTKADLAAVEASTGVVISGWTCNTNGDVRALVVDPANNRLYVAGSYSTIDGASRSDLAAVDADTGDDVTAWVCNSNGICEVLHLDVPNDALFVGGTFNGATGLDGQQRDRFGTVVASTGDLFVP